MSVKAGFVALLLGVSATSALAQGFYLGDYVACKPGLPLHFGVLDYASAL